MNLAGSRNLFRIEVIRKPSLKSKTSQNGLVLMHTKKCLNQPHTNQTIHDIKVNVLSRPWLLHYRFFGSRVRIRSWSLTIAPERKNTLGYSTELQRSRQSVRSSELFSAID